VLPPKKKKKPTRADVARLAGVSESTVSYALTGVRSISDETRDRIEAAMTELGYVPNAMAQALARKTSGMLALLFPVKERGFNETDYEYVQAVTAAVAAEGYQLLMWPNPVEDLDSLTKIVSQGIVDGLVLMEVRAQDPRLEVIERSEIPFCMIGRTDLSQTHTFVDADFSLWGPLGISHLADLGHKHVAVIYVEQDLIDAGYGPAVRVLGGLQEEAARARTRLEFVTVGANLRAGREAAEQLLDQYPDITAFIGFNEPAMTGAMETLALRGLRIPEDVSVMSFGLSEVAATMTVPAQTTVSVDAEELGRMAGEFLLERISGDRRQVLQHLVAPQLVDRGSTGPARARALQQN
jgi:DNA-binding LacI/PurR family transcriptional regulator